jgi:hypothetical protein
MDLRAGFNNNVPSRTALGAELTRMGLPTAGDTTTLQNKFDEENAISGSVSYSHPKTVSCPIKVVRAQMKEMFEKGTFSDVVVTIKSRHPGERSVNIALNRHILVHTCDFFRGMFTLTFRETDEDTVIVEAAEGSSVAATVLVLKYLYMAKIEIDSTNVLEVLVAADKFQIASLSASCETYLANRLCLTRVCSTWNASHVLGLSQLALKCKDLVSLKGKAVLESSGFSELRKELAMAVIEDDQLDATEEVVFEAVVAWGEANRGSGSVRDAISDFISRIRFDEMNDTFIHKRVNPSGLVPESILLDALMIIMERIVGCVIQDRDFKRAFDAECESKAIARPAKQRRRG